MAEGIKNMLGVKALEPQLIGLPLSSPSLPVNSTFFVSLVLKAQDVSTKEQTAEDANGKERHLMEGSISRSRRQSDDVRMKQTTQKVLLETFVQILIVAQKAVVTDWLSGSNQKMKRALIRLNIFSRNCRRG